MIILILNQKFLISSFAIISGKIQIKAAYCGQCGDMDDRSLAPFEPDEMNIQDIVENFSKNLESYLAYIGFRVQTILDIYDKISFS